MQRINVVLCSNLDFHMTKNDIDDTVVNVTYIEFLIQCKYPLANFQVYTSASSLLNKWLHT